MYAMYFYGIVVVLCINICQINYLYLFLFFPRWKILNCIYWNDNNRVHSDFWGLWGKIFCFFAKLLLYLLFVGYLDPWSPTTWKIFFFDKWPDTLTITCPCPTWHISKALPMCCFVMRNDYYVIKIRETWFDELTKTIILLFFILILRNIFIMMVQIITNLVRAFIFWGNTQ